ncbi:D-ribose pyranase [Pseudodesulfovibrio sp. zrk46]|uniref:D-ribose pyranase n=1 Tax=Pseudodesulfovibrio sp. zrk46 TaxID=2725288 RepID=UPI001449C342|nr:D-ribose pyranase [Pseudodesulfovibrio sp. zrk46]QJB57106.1 D-ribose pyranase [Pseudodesulfovibrio sp. zrk46]
MKRTKLINSELSYVLAKMGHFDAITIADAGLPIPPGVQRIDLAVSEGVPSFMDVVKAVVSEFEIESVELATEFVEVSPELHNELVVYLDEVGKERRREIPKEYMVHDLYKDSTKKSVAVVRTGEHTPYANITLKSGVVF